MNEVKEPSHDQIKKIMEDIFSQSDAEKLHLNIEIEGPEAVILKVLMGIAKTHTNLTNEEIIMKILRDGILKNLRIADSIITMGKDVDMLLNDFLGASDTVDKSKLN